MLWIIPALAAPALWAVSNLIDESLVRRTVRDPMALVLATGIFASLPAVAAVVQGRLFWPGYEIAAIALAGGALGLVVYFPYLKALELASPSSVILMWNLAPVMIVGLARGLAGEILSPPDYLAVVLLVLSSAIASVSPHPSGWFNKGFPWMAIASVLLAVAAVAEKATYQRLPFFAGFAWLSIGAMGTTAVLAILCRKSRQQLQDCLRTRTSAVLLANGGLDFAAVFALNLATSKAPVSIVHALGGLQPIFVLAFGGAKKSTPRELLRTGIAAGLAIVGIALIRASILE
jgi:drug/metabolite transporter (DMT)-like permease